MQLRPMLALVIAAAVVGGCGRSSSGDRAAAGAPPPLDVVTLGAAPADATVTVVLLHGYGAGGDDLVGLARALAVPASVRFVIPAAPIALDPAGTSRAWWPLDRAAWRGGRDRSDDVPAGLATARAQVDALLDRLEAEGARRIVLGGFSQGAILTVDVALQHPRPLAGLAVLSGTRLDGAAWRAHVDRVRGVPVLISHGTDDPVLPFAVARALRDQLAAAGADVEWIEFPGGHMIPAVTVAQLARLITRVASAP